MTRNSKSAPNPGEGKTYSLFDNDRETDAYFDCIRLLADDLVRQGTDIHHVLENVRKGSRTTCHLKKLALRALNVSTETSLARILREELSQYTVNVASHLRGLSLDQMFLEGQWVKGPRRCDPCNGQTSSPGKRSLSMDLLER